MEADALIFTRLITPDMSYFNYLLRNEFLKDHCIQTAAFLSKHFKQLWIF